MTKAKRNRGTQKEFLFTSSEKEDFLSDPPRPQDLGTLPVNVLELSARAKKWLRYHQINTLAQLVEASRKRLISQQCLDNQVRRELHRELNCYWNGKKFKYIFALNFLERGVEEILRHRKTRRTSLKHLVFSPSLQEILLRKKIKTVGQLLLQPELKWRNPRLLGNVLVNEILIALSEFLVRHQK